MLYNINPLYLHSVFHGIRFKVNKDWLSGIDSLLFFIYSRFVLYLCCNAQSMPMITTINADDCGNHRH